MTHPTDDRILQIWAAHVGVPSDKYPFGDGDKLAFARALLAEQARTEPVAWVYWHPSDTTHDGPDTLHKKAVSRFTDDTRKAMMAKGWLFEPLYPASTVAALKAQVAELEKDAARYRHLRGHRGMEHDSFAVHSTLTDDLLWGDDLDHEIDRIAAIAARSGT